MALTAQKKQELEERKRLAEEQQRVAEQKARVEALRKQREEKARKVEPEKPAVVVPPPSPPPEPKLLNKVTVSPGDDLQAIAARPDVYNDGFLLPLIYKANRDQIKDPKEIFPGQEFLVPRDKSDEEIAAARREAEELKLF